MAGELVIRRGGVEDAAHIAAIYNEAVLHSTATFDLEPETVEARRGWLQAATTRLCLVAELDGEVVGWGSLVEWSPRQAYARTAEASVYIAPGTQRSGVGLALSRALDEAAPGLGLHAVIAQICAENAGGLVLAERLGFERIGVLREVGHKFGRTLDVVVLERIVGAD